MRGNGADSEPFDLLLSMLLVYTEDDQQNIIMTGESAIGKSWVATQIADLFPREDVIELAYSSPSAFFYEQGQYDKEKTAIIIDMQRKIIVWLDMPQNPAWERVADLMFLLVRTYRWSTGQPCSCSLWIRNSQAPVSW